MATNIECAKSIVRLMNGWLKSHGLGNDYIVFNANNLDVNLDKETIRRICDRNYGIGSDGVLLLVASNKADFGLKIFNPDGSQAEKSGNGIRIFADYLYNMGFTSKTKFDIEVSNAVVRCEASLAAVSGKIEHIEVEIGKATFVPERVPVRYEGKEALDIPLVLDGENYIFSAVSVGNPHAVCIVDNLTNSDIKRIGPLVENHPIFPNRTNVQFVQVIDRGNIKIEIWERGAGYTLASGSSSCGVVAVLYKKGLVDNSVNVHMPGGVLRVSINDYYDLKLKGPVAEIACGVLLDAG